MERLVKIDSKDFLYEAVSGAPEQWRRTNKVTGEVLLAEVETTELQANTDVTINQKKIIAAFEH